MILVAFNDNFSIGCIYSKKVADTGQWDALSCNTKKERGNQVYLRVYH